MKKITIAIIVSVILISLTACGSEDSSVETSEAQSAITDDSSTTESSIVSTVESSVIEEVSEVESEKTENEEAEIDSSEETSADSASDESENTDVQAEYMGISFIVPARAEYEESDSNFTITFESQKRMAVIAATDVSDFDLDQELASSSNLLAIASTMAAYEETQNENTADITVAGVTGKSTTALVKISNTWFSAAFIAFSNEDFTYTYCISYVTATDSESDHSDYAAFLESISFN